MIKLKFCGGAGIVTGACYFLETPKTKILVDCGMFQGSRFSEILNEDKFPFDPKEIDAVLLTHAHIDHIGRLPKLLKEGFRGKIFGTPPTIDFARALLADAEHIMRMEAEKEGWQPIYSLKDVDAVFPLTEMVGYEQTIQISEDLSCRFQNAGHILGSSIIEVFVAKEDNKSTKIVFSGDLGNSPAPLLNKTKDIAEADYVIIESAYGDRMHGSRDETQGILEDVVEETIKAGGVLIIPSFATERTQELLYELNKLVENGRIPRVPVFIDSPLAIKITEIYKKYPEFYNREAVQLIKSGDEIFNFPGLKFSETIEQSKQINAVHPPKIIVAGSGMSHGGRVLYHEKLYLPDPKSAILMIGYQIAGSIGRKLLDGEQIVRIHGADVHVRARVIQVSGYSAHADQKQLIQWLEPMRLPLKKVFVVQGEENASSVFAGLVMDKLAVSAVVPKLGEEFILE
ncbi:MAG: MBL fold metallo-hydrolase [Patescibacteria group bacterium]